MQISQQLKKGLLIITLIPLLSACDGTDPIAYRVDLARGESTLIQLEKATRETPEKANGLIEKLISETERALEAVRVNIKTAGETRKALIEVQTFIESEKRTLRVALNKLEYSLLVVQALAETASNAAQINSTLARLETSEFGSEEPFEFSINTGIQPGLEINPLALDEAGQKRYKSAVGKLINFDMSSLSQDNEAAFFSALERYQAGLEAEQAPQNEQEQLFIPDFTIPDEDPTLSEEPIEINTLDFGPPEDFDNSNENVELSPSS